MRDLVREEFVKSRKKNSAFWETESAFVAFKEGWSACVALVTPEANDALAKGVAQCVRDGTLTTEHVEAISASLLGPLVVKVEEELLDWAGAELHLASTENAYASIASTPGVNAAFGAGVAAGVRARFDKGERTSWLHREIMELS